MKTIRKMYKHEGRWTFAPAPEVKIEEIYFLDGSTKPYCMAIIEHEAFRENLTKIGQARKNALRKNRDRLLGNFTDQDIERFTRACNFLRSEKIKALPVVNVEIHYDGRQVKNMSLFLQAVAMDINVGGISPQYVSKGFRGYKIG